MRKTIAAILLAVGLTLALGTSALADPHGKGYETGDLNCGGTVYTVYASGFGSSFRVTTSTTVLVFRSGTLTNVDTGAVFSVEPSGAKEGIDAIECTGQLVNPVIGATYDVDFTMSIGP
jgi:hypothetical protein